MLNSFDKVRSGRGLLPAFFQPESTPMAPAGKDRPAASGVNQGIFLRIYVRRWLLLLFTAIAFSLSAIYGLPVHAAFLASAIFAAGAALIPRSGMPSIPRPFSLIREQETYPLKIASALIGGLPEPAMLLSQDGTVLAFNGKASDLFSGLKAGFHLSVATRNPQILDAVAECLPGAPPQTVMFSERVPVERSMAATVSWACPPGCTTPCILLFMRDLTEQRRLDQLRSDFIANASHEIKTPLASVLGFIETLQGAARQDEAARDRFLAIMAKQAQRMARLIDNLMSLSRVEMRAHLKPQDPVLIAELAAQACEALEPMAAEANIKVSLDSRIGGATVLGDRDELLQVLINLLHNAIKYGVPGGTAGVTLSRQRDAAKTSILISVEDDGPGISAQHLPRLTERFYRVPGAGALEKGGTGLGLAIVKHVVNRHRGEFRIFSEEGKGSKFTILLEEQEGEEQTGARS